VTTIAWDGKSLAADTLMGLNGIPREATKIWKLPLNRLLGCSGDYQDGLLVKEYLLDPGTEKEKPKLEDNFNAILIEKKVFATEDGEAFEYKIYKLESKLIPIPIKEQHMAIGCGRDFAFAAMHLGCSASSAIEVAMAFDIYTGGKIDVLTI
jgi:hypothetical protein